VDVGAAFPSDAQTAELVQPTQGALHHPAVDSQPAAVGGVASRQNRLDATKAQLLAMPFGVVPPVALDPVWPEAGSAHPASNWRNRVHQGQQLGHIVAVGPCENGRQRDAVRVRDDVVFGPVLTAIRRIGADLRPPKTARTEALSTTAREKSIWPTPRSRASKARCTSSHTPASCQSRSRRQQVMPEPQPISWGKSSHGIPVFNTKRIPVRTWRSSSGLRPGYRNRRGAGGGRNGAMNSHNSSSKIGLAMKVPPFHDHNIANQSHPAIVFLLEGLNLIILSSITESKSRPVTRKIRIVLARDRFEELELRDVKRHWEG